MQNCTKRVGINRWLSVPFESEKNEKNFPTQPELEDDVTHFNILLINPWFHRKSKCTSVDLKIQPSSKQADCT